MTAPSTRAGSPSPQAPQPPALTAAFLISTQLAVSQLGHGAAPNTRPWEGRQQNDDTEEHWQASHHGLRAGE